MDKKQKQYSKRWMSIWQAFCMFWLSLYFIGDIYFNKCEHLEGICLALITSIVGTCFGYFCKSYYETKREKDMEYMYDESDRASRTVDIYRD